MSRKRTPQDFSFKEQLGHGSYSTVYKAVDRNSGQVFAIKICSKRHIISEKKVKYVTIEKNTLNLLAHGNHPGIIKLYYTFHDSESLYFVLDFAPGGELLQLLQARGRFSEGWSQHFMAQLVDALEYIHSCKVVHRDLKPENVLLSTEGRLMITDFGAASNTGQTNDSDADASSSSFVGTAEYVSPELLLENRSGYSSDVWALGCILYQFTQGSPPFRGTNELAAFEKIVNLDYQWKWPVSSLLKDLVGRILVLDPCARYTLKQIQRHKWFRAVDWNNKDELWKGIWQVDRQQALPQRPSVMSKQLHVINTPIRSIPIQPSKKKPMKTAQTTSSIVEWRKNLGLAAMNPSIGLNGLPKSNAGSPAKPGSNTAFAARPAANSQKSASPSGPKSATISAPPSAPPSASATASGKIKNGKTKPTPTLKTALPGGPVGSARTGVMPSPVTPVSPVNSRLPDNASLSPRFASHRANSTHLKKPPSTPSASPSALKQGWVKLLEIPYVASQRKTLSSTDYSFIDDRLIAKFISQQKSDIARESTLSLMTLDSSGKLSYCSKNKPINNMVSIVDLDLSIYDSEFNETKNSGYLILEKYKSKIWFVTLPKRSPEEGVVNAKETWIDCLFNARSMLETEKLSAKVDQISITAGSRKPKDSKQHKKAQMFVSSSRYEVLNTLHKQKTGNTDAANGASAAFKNMNK